jgi:hypothetical protein
MTRREMFCESRHTGHTELRNNEGKFVLCIAHWWLKPVGKEKVNLAEEIKYYTVECVGFSGHLW